MVNLWLFFILQIRISVYLALYFPFPQFLIINNNDEYRSVGAGKEI